MTPAQTTLEIEQPTPSLHTASVAGLRCAACGKRLKSDHCVIGRDRRLTDGRRLPRYCWPGEGCHK